MSVVILRNEIHLILYFIDGGAQVKFNKFGYILINTIFCFHVETSGFLRTVKC